jgi:hypothetical protein
MATEGYGLGRVASITMSSIAASSSRDQHYQLIARIAALAAIVTTVLDYRKDKPNLANIARTASRASGLLRIAMDDRTSVERSNAGDLRPTERPRLFRAIHAPAEEPPSALFLSMRSAAS